MFLVILIFVDKTSHFNLSFKQNTYLTLTQNVHFNIFVILIYQFTNKIVYMNKIFILSWQQKYFPTNLFRNDTTKSRLLLEMKRRTWQKCE